MKVLITLTNLSKYGGIETYVKNLVNFLISIKNHNIEIFIFPVFSYDKNNINDFLKNDKITILDNEYLIRNFYGIARYKKISKKFKFYCDTYNFDILIDNVSVLPVSKEILSQSNYYYVQHFNVNNLLYKCTRLTNILKRFWFFLINYPLKFKYSKNIVCFTNEDKKIIEKKNKTSSIFPIQLAAYNSNEIYNYKEKILENLLTRKKNELLYMGRIVKKTKKINLCLPLLDIFKKKKWNFQFYGDGKYKRVIEKKIEKKIELIIENDKKKKIAYQETLFSFLVSSSEGFPFSVVESLSCGTPVILRNTFPTCSFFKPCIFIDKYYTKKKMTKEIINIIDQYKSDVLSYAKLCLESLDFALEFLSNETFEKKWYDIIFNN